MLPTPSAATLQVKLTRCELVAESAARRALHDGLGPFEADLTFANRRDVEIRFANQQRAELGLAQCAEELGKAAARHVDVQRLLVMTQNLELDLPARDLAEHAVDRRPFAARAALDAIADCCEQLLRPVRKACFTMASALSLPSSVRNARSTGSRTWACMRVLSRRDTLGSTR